MTTDSVAGESPTVRAQSGVVVVNIQNVQLSPSEVRVPVGTTKPGRNIDPFMIGLIVAE